MTTRALVVAREVVLDIVKPTNEEWKQLTAVIDLVATDKEAK